jgi:hypothetical protein
MSFLTPLFLFGLLAAAIPVAIHLIRKEKPPKIIFSTLRFLKTTSKKLVLFQRIQQWLLLLLRAAVICLLVFAFARPLFDSSVSRLVDADPESVVILLDVSMSMQYGDRYEQAIEAALDTIDELGPGDQIAVIAFSSAALRVRELSSDFDAVRSFVRDIDGPGFDTTRFMPVLRLANDMLNASQYQSRRVQLISDFQATGLLDEDSGWQLSPGIIFDGIDVGQGISRNLYFADVRSPTQLIESRSEYAVLARVRSAGSVHIDEGIVRIFIDGEEQEQARVSLGDVSEQVVRLPVSVDSLGAHRGEIRVGSDDFEQDNSYFFTLSVIPKVKVLVVNGEPSSNWFEDEAHWFSLAVTSSEESPFTLTSVTTSQLSSSMLAASDVVVMLNSGSDLNGTQARAIQSFVEGGGSLFLAPGDRVDAQGFNQLLGAVSPVRLMQSTQPTGANYLMVADLDRRHPVLLALESEWNVRFEGYWTSELVPGAQVLMEFDSGAPAFVEKSLGQGNVLLLASTLDTEWNNLPLQSFFLPFVHESLRYLAQPASTERAYQIGDVIDLTDLAENTASLRLSNALGENISLDGEGLVYSAREIGFVEANSPNGNRVLAVNSAPEESRLERVSVAAVQDRVTNPDTKPVQSDSVRTAELVAALEGPQRLWWWILLLTIMLLLAETRVANTTYR